MIRSSITFFVILFININLFAGDVNPPTRGYFLNSKADKCYYSTSINKMKYFSNMEDRVITHTFESDTMMINDVASKRMIANVICRWYKGTKFQKDTKFKTSPSDWEDKGEYQKKGLQIVSSNYSIPKVWIDFEYDPNKEYILKVHHVDGF